MKLKFLLFCYTLFSVSVCNAQFQQQIAAPDPVPAGFFGKSVAIHDDVMLVGATGAYNEIDRDEDAGAVYVYRKTGNNWTVQQKIVEPLMGLYSDFGYSVDVSENYAIVGAPRAGSSGAAFIYKKTGDTWELQLRLPEKYRSHFGYSVAITDNYAIVGAIYAKGNGPSWSDRGSAWIYARTEINGVETWTEVAHLGASDEFDRAHFGFKVDLSDQTAVVSAYTNAANENYNRSGVYVFERIGDSWIEVIKLQPKDGLATDREQFGWDINLYNNQIIVGTPQDVVDGEVTGSAYIFEKHGDVWKEQAKLLPAEESVRGFGTGVEIRDDLAVVGGITSNHQGSGFVFRKTAEGWKQITKLYNPDTENNGYVTYSYGDAIGMSASDIVIGQHDACVTATMDGIAFVYDKAYLHVEGPATLQAAYQPGSVFLSWQDNATNETAYMIERAANSNFDLKETFHVSQNATTFEDNSVKRNTTYFYRVSAYNDAVYSASSNTVEIYTGTKNPDQAPLTVYPNPGSGVVSLQVTEAENISGKVKVEISNLSGKVVYSQDHLFSELQEGFQLPAHLSGMFILSLRTDSRYLKSKIIINP